MDGLCERMQASTFVNVPLIPITLKQFEGRDTEAQA